MKAYIIHYDDKEYPEDSCEGYWKPLFATRELAKAYCNRENKKFIKKARVKWNGEREWRQKRMRKGQAYTKSFGHYYSNRIPRFRFEEWEILEELPTDIINSETVNGEYDGRD